jgi:hypothetical protein
MTRKTDFYSSHGWFGKASAGLILGFAIALAVSGIFAVAGPGGLMHSSAKTQINMWMMGLIWPLVLSFCFLFRSGLRAWFWLGLTTAILFAGLFVLKSVFGGGL